MNYQEEVKNLEAFQNTDWFKPTRGMYKIEVTGEGQFIEKTFGEGDKAETITQWNLPVNVNGKAYWWSVTKGKTLSSLYGQIVALAAANNNVATGLKFSLAVKSDGSKNSYTIPEALNLASQEEISQGSKTQEILEDVQ